MTKIVDYKKYQPINKITIEGFKILANRLENYKQEHNIVFKGSLIGIEVEVENVPSPPAIAGWHLTDDGSLRNHGVEFVSFPMKAEQAEVMLKYLFQHLPQTASFSKRTSVHVHVNMRVMELEQIKSLILVYLIFERALFDFVGQNRDKNIHCVPIRDTYFLESIRSLDNPELFSIDWMKYTALNLCPIIDGSKGTMEFRHMHGTRDVNKLLNWINLILSMQVYAMATPAKDLMNEIQQLNTNSEYRRFANDVFGPLTDLLIVRPSATYGKFEYDLEEGISLIKTYNSTRQFYSELFTCVKRNGIEVIPKPKKVYVNDYLNAFSQAPLNIPEPPQLVDAVSNNLSFWTTNPNASSSVYTEFDEGTA